MRTNFADLANRLGHASDVDARIAGRVVQQLVDLHPQASRLLGDMRKQLNNPVQPSADGLLERSIELLMFIFSEMDRKGFV